MLKKTTNRPYIGFGPSQRSTPNNKLPKCIFIKKGDSSFIDADVTFLKTFFRTVVIDHHNSTGWRFWFYHLRGLLKMIFHLNGTRFIYIWFADYQSFIPLLLARVFGIRSYMIIGGFDAANIPEIRYGGHINPFRHWCIVKSCQMAHKILPVSRFAFKMIQKNTGLSLFSKSTILYNAYNTSVFNNLIFPEYRKIDALTVCGGSQMFRYKLKGLDVVIRLANNNPIHSFCIVGPSGVLLEHLRKVSPPNVTLIPPQSQQELKGLFSQSKVILQFSIFESFGLSVLEAMCCGCFPIVNKETGLSEVVSQKKDLSSIIDVQNPSSLQNAFSTGIQADDVTREAIRQHALNSFQDTLRQKKIIQILTQAQ